jgi:dihydroorotate dehydrogenase (NAD+) catalytic subunit
MVETPAGMLNSIGLANVGVQDFMAKKVPFLDSLNPATVVNVSGAQIEDYINVVETLEASPGIWGYEINVSCPNVKEGGMAFGTSPKMVAFVTQELRKRTDRPLIVKLSPNVTDITEIALAAEGAGADGPFPDQYPPGNDHRYPHQKGPHPQQDCRTLWPSPSSQWASPWSIRPLGW